MAVELGDIVAQIGSGTYRLVKGKDVDITEASDGSSHTITDDDIFLIDDSATGSQASTLKITGAQLKTYIGAGSSLTTEEVEDIVGAMFDGGTETRIAATYDDSGGKINLVVDDMTADTNTNQLTTFTIRDDDNDDSTVAQGKFVKFTKGIGANGVDITGSGTTGDPFVVAISSPAIPSVGDGGLTTNDFTDGDHTKLNGIEATADVTSTTNVTAAGALMDSELTDLAGVKGVTISTLQVKPSEGAFADGDKTKLNGIEATADVTDTTNVASAGALMDSELTDLAGVKGVTISTLQVKPSEGAFADGDKTKLDGIEASADVTDATNVASAGALMDSEVTNLADVKAFDTSDYATAAQGAKADSAQQPPSEGAFANGDKTKLDTVDTNADVTSANTCNSPNIVQSDYTTGADVTGDNTCDTPNVVQTTVSGNAGTVTNGVYTTDAVTVLNGNSGARATTITSAEASAISTNTTNIALKANIASPTFTGTVGGITKTMVGLGNVDNTTDAGKPVSTATQTAIDAVQSDVDANESDADTALATKLNLSGGTMTGALTMSSGDKLQFVDANEFLSSDGTDLTIGSGGNVKINPAGGQVIIEDDDVAEPILEIKSTANSTGAGGLRFTKDRGSAGTDGDNIGIVNWYGQSSDNSEHLYAQIVGQAPEIDAADEEGRLKFNVSTQHASFGALIATGLQLDGTTTDGQIDVIIGAGSASTTAVSGNLTAVGTINGVTFTDVASLKSALSLNNVSNDAQMPLAGGIFTGPATVAGNPTNDLHIAPKQYVDAKRFSVTTDQLNYRMGYVNKYYVGNQSLDTSVGSADFQRYEAPYAVYTAKDAVQVHSWTVYGSVSSTVSYEYELWDVTNSADGGSGNSAAAKIGSTQAFNGVASRMYTIGESGLDYTLAAGHQLYVVKRYTSGSGNKYTYATVTVQLEVM